MNALEHNHTWDLVSLSLGTKAIGCKWIFVVKMNSNGSFAWLKVHLVAKDMLKHMVLIISRLSLQSLNFPQFVCLFY